MERQMKTQRNHALRPCRTLSVLMLIGAAAYLLPGSVLADSVDPETFEATLRIGDSVTINKTVTIDKTGILPVDVVFMTDATGSMRTAIDNVQSISEGLLAGLQGVYTDIRFGAASYRDFPVLPFGRPTDYPFRLEQNLTFDTDAVVDAIETWVPSGGNDIPEANFYALEQVASQASWRAEAAKVVVWFGDNPGHENPPETDYPVEVTRDTAISALNAAGVNVVAFNLEGAGLGIDGDEIQATEVADGTGGAIVQNVASVPVDELADLIINTIGATVDFYDIVGLELLDPALTGVGVEISPASYTGDFDRTIEREFDFEVTFTGLAPGVYEFELGATVDGIVVAKEFDTITVTNGPDPTPAPAPATLALMGLGLLIGARLRRRSAA
jgi:hypothetical protein